MIRQMIPEDAEQAAELEKSSFAIAWTLDDFKRAASDPNYLYFVDQEEGIVRGFCGVLLSIDEGDITNIAVREDCRRQHIGQQLIRTLLQETDRRGILKIFLEVRKSNLAAQRLYQKNGFQITGTRKNYYRKPTEDAYVMMREREHVQS